MEIKIEHLNPTLRLNESISETPQYGLLHGHAGMAIVYYLLAKQTSNNEYKAIGMELLNEISDNILSVDELCFEKGVAGIGWAIEWLVQNGLLEDTNTDEVLGDVDDTIYKTVTYASDKRISLSNGILGKLAYYLKRWRSRNPGTNRYKQILHQECIVLLTDDIFERLHKEDGKLNIPHLILPTGAPFVLQSLIDLATMLQLLGNFIKVNEPTVEDSLYECIKCTEELLGKICGEKPGEDSDFYVDYYCNLLYLAVCYYIAGKKHKHDYWQHQATKYIKRLQEFHNYSTISDESIMFKKLAIYSLLNVNFPELNYSDKIVHLLQIINMQPLPAKLYNGTGTVILSQLCMDNPGLIEDWHEILFIN